MRSSGGDLGGESSQKLFHSEMGKELLGRCMLPLFSPLRSGVEEGDL